MLLCKRFGVSHREARLVVATNGSVTNPSCGLAASRERKLGVGCVGVMTVSAPLSAVLVCTMLVSISTGSLQALILSSSSSTT